MNKAREELTARKSLLLARSAVYRLTLAQQAEALREGLQPRRLAASVPMRPLVIAALALFAGRTRIARLVGLATRALMVVKLVRAVREMTRSKVH